MDTSWKVGTYSCMPHKLHQNNKKINLKKNVKNEVQNNNIILFFKFGQVVKKLLKMVHMSLRTLETLVKENN